MEITNKNHITFGAIPCRKTHIKVYNEVRKEFKKCPATLVKLEAGNLGDRAAIHFARETWQDAKYIKKIATASGFTQFSDIEVYALTTQTKNFEKLLFNRIIGFVEMRPNKNGGFLNRLQVRPDAINVNQENKKTHKHVGKAILSSLKKLYKNISLNSEDSPNIERFYRNNGFIEDYYDEGLFNWHSNPFMRLKLIIKNAMAKRLLLIKADKEY